VSTARNVAIIAAIAAAIAFLPGGGDVAAVVSRTLGLAFAGVIAWAGWWAYRRFAMDLDALPPGFRGLLYAAIGVVVLVVAGSSRLTATTSGSLVFIALLGAAVLAFVAVWRAHRELG
jgi:hypothetical protein